MKLFLIRIIEYIISLCLCLFIIYNLNIDGILLSSYTAWIPMTLMIINIILIIIEFKKSKPIFRLIISIIFLIISLINGISSIEMLNLSVCLYGFLYLIVICFVLVKTNIANVKENKNNKVLPIGIYSRKQLKKNNIDFSISTVTSVIFCLYLWYFSTLKIWVIIIILFLSLFCLFIICLMKNDPLINLLKKANNGKLNEALDELNELKNNNIHPETLNYLKIIEANYTIPKDKDRAIEIFNEVYEPNKKQYILNYYIVKICIYINNKDIDKAIENKNILKEKYPKNINIIQIEKMLISFTNPNDFDPLKSFKLDSKILFNKLCNLYNIMDYYKRINDIENAKKYAKLVLAECKEMDYYQQQAKIILGDENENENSCV